MNNFIALVLKVTGHKLKTQEEAIQLIEDVLEGSLDLTNESTLAADLRDFEKSYKAWHIEQNRIAVEHYAEFDSGNEHEQNWE
jgi:mannitol/fructose-specific phosphotransferase system IIA component (Ntr-type)